MSIIILNEHIPNVNIFESALKVPYTKINTLTSETAISSLIQNLDTQYNLTTTQTIGLVWENNYLFNDMFHSLTQDKINGSNYFDLFEYFIQQIANINNNIIVDLITCDLNITNIINKLTSLEQTYYVDIRYSLNGTGSYINGDWILESDNIDIKNIYFNENINNYDVILGDDLGENGAAFIGQNGLVYSTGRNLFGEIGDNTTTQRTTFTQMSNITNATKLSSGARNKFIITSNTNIYGVGSNLYRQLGINSSTNPIKLATQMKDTDGTSLLTNVSDVASGYTQTFVIKTNGSLYSCGTNKDRANRARGTLARGVTNTSTYGYIGECKYANNVNVTNAEKIMCGYYHKHLS